ncbi:MAG: PQQ-binding-like beta-propeller repeat protein [Planctomycetota bacterium]|nr:PQQ-binding-like beta-propeller repeat protein [Planctomycetota bacterium]
MLMALPPVPPSRGGIRGLFAMYQQENSVIGQPQRPLKARRIASLAFATTSMLLATLAGCSPASDKSAAGQDSGKVVVLTEPAFVEGWNTQLRMDSGETVKAIYVTPDVVDDTVHVVTDKNYDHVIRRTTGDFLFFNQIGSPGATLMGPPLLIPQRMVFLTDHTLEVYRRNGHFEKSIDLHAFISSPGVAKGSLVYLGLAQSGGEVAAVEINQEVNPIRWNVITRGAVDGAPAISSSSIFVGSESGGLLGLADDHTSAWPTLDDSTFMTSGKILGDVKADSDSVYVSSSDAQIYCLFATTGKIRWRYFASAALDKGPDLTATSVYQYVPNEGVVAIDKTVKIPLEGSDNKFLGENPVHPARWTCADAVRFLSEDKKFTYVLSKSNTVLALDKQTGERKFETHRSDLVAFTTSNNPKDATIYAATKDGLVISIRPVTTPGTSGEVVFIQAPLNAGPLASAGN